MADEQVIVCSNCGVKNRVEKRRLQSDITPVCGRCRSPLVASAGPITVTDADFATKVERSSIPVLLDLWAPWCGPCRVVGPVLEQIAGEFAGRIQVAKLNIDQNPLTTSRFGVQSIPTMILLKQGKEVDRIVGAVPKQEILRHLQAAI